MYVCSARGLPGSRGVVIPRHNVNNLMLREDVVEACREGKFHVFKVETIDQALEILLDEPAETVHEKTRGRLYEMTEKIQRGREDKEEQ